MRNVFLHLHPVQVSEASLRFNRTYGLGGMAALLIVIQILTGILLRFYYVPSPAEAYNSIVFLRQHVLFGPFIRNLHHWSGVFLLLIAFLHFLRVFFTGAFREQRKINWLFGLVLLFLLVFSNFTGYLLPWDQLAFWAVTVATTIISYLLPWDQLAFWAVTVATTIISYLPVAGRSLRELILGGQEVNAVTLQTFFTFHTAVLPFLLLGLVLYHFWRVRKAGGVLLPGTSVPREMVPAMPNLVFREFIVALVLVAVLFTFSALFDAPLLGKANPAYSMNPTKAPWYFAGVQELLMHFHPVFAAFIIPAAVIAFLAWIPFLEYGEPPSGQWFITEQGKHSSVSAAVFAVLVTLAGILFNEYVLDFEVLLPGFPAVVSNGIIPLVILLVWVAAYYRFFVRRLRLSKPELVQVIFVFIMAAFIVLTLTGIFFRGKDMALTLPWVG